MVCFIMTLYACGLPCHLKTRTDTICVNGKLAQLTNDSRSKTSNDNVYLQGQLVFHPMKGWNIYANVGLRLISQFKKQNLNKVYEYNVENEPLLLSYGSTYTAGQTGAMQHWTNDNHLTTSYIQIILFPSTNTCLK